MFIMMYILFLKIYDYILSILIVFEFISLVLIYLIYEFMFNYLNEYFLLYYLIFVVCEGVLGLGLIVNMIRIYNNQMMESLMILKW